MASLGWEEPLKTTGCTVPFSPAKLPAPCRLCPEQQSDCAGGVAQGSDQRVCTEQPRSRGGGVCQRMASPLHRHRQSHPGGVDCPRASWVRSGAEEKLGSGGIWGPLPLSPGQPPRVSPPQRQSTYPAWSSLHRGPQPCLLVNSPPTLQNTDVQIKGNLISLPTWGLFFFFSSSQ